MLVYGFRVYTRVHPRPTKLPTNTRAILIGREPFFFSFFGSRESALGYGPKVWENKWHGQHRITILLNIVGAHYRKCSFLGPVYTMDHEVRSWKMAFSYGPISPVSVVRSLKEINFTKSVGPSLGVNPMWTKRTDHSPKMNMLIFLICAPKWHQKKIKFDHSIVCFCLHLLPLQKT
jgi:hypothetical protein